MLFDSVFKPWKSYSEFVALSLLISMNSKNVSRNIYVITNENVLFNIALRAC